MTNPRNIGLSVDVLGTLVWSLYVPNLVVLHDPRGTYSLAQVKGDKELYDTMPMRDCLTERNLIRLFNPDGSGVVERWKFAISPEGLIALYSLYRGTTLPFDLLKMGEPVIHTGQLQYCDRYTGSWNHGMQPFGRLRR